MASIRTRQIAGVTALVGAVVVGLSALQISTLARVSFDETVSRAELLANAVFQAASKVTPGSTDLPAALRTDPGVRSVLESSVAYARNVTYAAIVDPRDVVIAHSFPTFEGRVLPRRDGLARVGRAGTWAALRAIYSDRLFEVRQPLLLGGRDFGAIRIGVSMLLIQESLSDALGQALRTALMALVITMLGAMLLARWMLRPIHIIGRGLARLGRGEFNVRLDLPPGDEFRGLGSSFEEVSAQLAALRGRSPAREEAPAAEALEDALAFVDRGGRLLHANEAFRAVLPSAEPGRPVADWLPAGHVARAIVEDALRTGLPQGPVSTTLLGSSTGDGNEERLIVASPIDSPAGAEHPLGVLLVVRNQSYLDRVQSTINYSRKLASFGRLMSGVAHEVKNPLNAMTIHLELLKQKLDKVPAAGAGGSDLTRHVDTISGEIRRLDRTMAGLLKFTRPEELHLRAVSLVGTLTDVARALEPDADSVGVNVHVDCPAGLLDVSADAAMLQQALVNLGTNACQAMPEGGTLTLRGRKLPRRRVEIEVSDTGVGIPTDQLGRIFDLYFTTKPQGSGIGLSLVYRIVLLHDGEIAVESTPGRGTTFRITLPQA